MMYFNGIDVVIIGTSEKNTCNFLSILKIHVTQLDFLKILSLKCRIDEQSGPLFYRNILKPLFA